MKDPCGSCHPSVYEHWCSFCIPSPDPKRWPFPVLNPVQTAAWQALERDPTTNLIVATGTGTGKTACAEFAIARLKPPGKAMVMEPLKALAREKVQDWSRRFPHLKFVELTSDADLGIGKERNERLQPYDVIVCSYEVLDSMTRRPDTYTILDSVKLLVIDEVHELGDTARGGSLDGALTRFFLAHRPQVIALSATFDNVEHLKSYLEQFVSPVELITLPFSPIKVNAALNIVPYPHNGREAVMVAETLKLMGKTKGGILTMCLSIPSVDAITHSLNATQPGCAVAHYSEMSAEDRHDVEDLYRAKGARVIVSTPTLLAGVNIPCQSIVLDVSYFDQDHYRTAVLPVTKIRQAAGRVGRLPWYKEGWVTYVCQQNVIHEARRELAKPMLVEGSLLNAVDGVINTEVQMASVTTKRALLEWYERTYSRFSAGADKANIALMLEDEVGWLAQHGFLKLEDRATGRLRGAFRGQVANQHMLRPRWLVSAEEVLRETSVGVIDDGTTGTREMLGVLQQLSETPYCPFNWTERKTTATLRIMGYEKVLGDGRLDWGARDENYQWVRDIADNLGRLTGAAKRLREDHGDGFHAADILAVCFARGCVPPKLAKLSRLLTTAGMKGIGYKRLLLLYSNGLTAEAVADGKVPNKFGLPRRCNSDSLFDAQPEDFYDWEPNFDRIMPQHMMETVLAAIGRHAA